MVEQGALGVVESEDPRFVFRLQTLDAEARRAGHHQLARIQIFDGRGDFGQVQLGNAKLPVVMSTWARPARRSIKRDARQIAVFMRFEEARLGDCAGRDDAGDLAAH